MADELLNEVIRHATFAADDAVMGKTFRTPAEVIRAAVTAAFELAAGNGLIRITPIGEWPKYIALTPPYEPPARSLRTAGEPASPEPPTQEGTQS